uniref:PsyA n=1 Tax=Penicillium sp. YT-2016 TaxID=1813945 RepID=A0A142DX11_9EURO|nr:PsyA [Penicillium sp. YT-2016]
MPGTIVLEPRTLSSEDLCRLKQWNALIPESQAGCVHQLINTHCEEQPDAEAVSAWDGSFTYGELARVTDHVSAYLVEHGVGPEVVVPILLEKSRWVPLAMVSVMKAGGAFMLLDSGHPPSRLTELCARVGAEIMITSRGLAASSECLGVKAVAILDEESSAVHHPLSHGKTAAVDVKPRNLLYVVFTSGSTGQPKGVLIEHGSYVAGAQLHIPALHMGRSSRIFQFASNAFDAIITDTLSTLIAGGCVCIPSEGQRIDQCIETLDFFRATHVFLTPSFARTLSHQRPSKFLQVLVLIGEVVQDSDVTQWAHKVTIMNGYGPAECSAAATVQSHLSSASSPRNIGHRVCGGLWLVNPDDVDQLAAIGEVGELLIEGPTVGRGYLDDPGRTNAVFIRGPAWLKQVRGHDNHENSRLYLTGDLMCYEADGSLCYIGRKDSQVKLRGQRIELPEVEDHVRQALPKKVEVVVEMVPIAGINQSLVAFIQCDLGASTANGNGDSAANGDIVTYSTGEFKKQVLAVKTRLAATLPSFMVPGFFIPVQRFPLTRAGKVDRKNLRGLLAHDTHSLDHFRILDEDRRPPSTEREQALQRVWSEALNIAPDMIGAEDNFFHFGGDSITAIFVVAGLRAAGYELTVAEILGSPRLSHVASLMRDTASMETQAHMPPFSLLGTHDARDPALEAAARQCQVDVDLVEDIYPCTSLQEGLFALGASQQGAYVGRWTYAFNEATVDPSRLRRAWNEVAQSNAILRTRIIKTPSHRMYQVVLRNPVAWEDPSRCTLEVEFGRPLVMFALKKDPRTQSFQLTVTMHHALYDAWSLQLLLDQVEAIYLGQSHQSPPPFNRFVKYISKGMSDTKQERFWRAEFAGLAADPFPSFQHTHQRPTPSVTHRRTINPAQFSPRMFTRSTVARLAWALVQSQYQNRTDVVFGATVSGRTAPVSGVESMTGPTIATIPWRVQLHPERTVAQSLEEIQSQTARCMPYEQVGMHHMKNWGEEAKAACSFQTLLLVQQNERGAGLPLLGVDEDSGNWRAFATYALTVFCDLNSAPFGLEAWFDPDIIPAAQVERLLNQFAHIIEGICHGMNASIADLLASVCSSHVQQMLEWNQMPDIPQVCVHDLFAQRCQEHPVALAVDAWDGTFTYAELDKLSTSLARYLSSRGVCAGWFVPICSEKSRWVVMCMLAIIKTGAAFVLLDPSHPKKRLDSACKLTQTPLVICSRDALALALDLTGEVIVSSGDYSGWGEDLPTQDCVALPNVDPGQPLFVAFTSGSTGIPKGVLVTHNSYLASTLPIVEQVKISPGVRWLQFASFAFDMSAVEILWTIICGGCLCILSESQRLDEFASAAASFQPTHAFLVPSFARTLNPETLPSLRALLLAGEPPNAGDIQLWCERVSLMNLYGPAETGITHGLYHYTQSTAPTNVGRNTGSATWLVHPDDPERPVPIGAVGEALIEGPNVGPGYLRDPERTAVSFIQVPKWLQGLRGRSDGIVYLTGDLFRCDEDGCYIYLGRKDNQVKLRGQRIELGDVETHVQTAFDAGSLVIVELVTQAAGITQPCLVAFIFNPSLQDRMDDLFSAPNTQFSAQVVVVKDRLQKALPRFMIPSYFIPLSYIPRTTSGKVDRRQLRLALSTLPEQQITEYLATTAKREPSTEIEKRLQHLWAKGLRLAPEDIGVDDNFFDVGGDSIKAMYLAATARDEGLALTVTDILQTPTLSALAQQCTPLQSLSTPEVVPFSLVDEPTKSFVTQRVQDLGIISGEAHIVDIYPATEGQRWLIDQWSPVHFCYFISATIDPMRLRAGCAVVMARHSILRTAFVRTKNETSGITQVVLDAPEVPFQQLHTDEDLALYCDELWQAKGTLSSTIDTLPVKFQLLSRSHAEHALVIQLSHAQYDGVSLPILTSDLAAAYSVGAKSFSTTGTDFAPYVYFRSSRKSDVACNFWREYLRASSMFRLLPRRELSSVQRGPDDWPNRRVSIVRGISMPTAPSGITTASLIKAAAALVLAKRETKSDLVLGQTVNGRSMPLPGIERLLGACLNFIPFRVTFEPGWSAMDLLHHTHAQCTQTLEYDYMGLSEILQQSSEMPPGTQFGCVVQHQNIAQTGEQGPELVLDGVTCQSSALANFNPMSGLWILSTPRGESLEVMTCTVEELLSPAEARGLNDELCETIMDLAQNPDASLDLNIW